MTREAMIIQTAIIVLSCTSNAIQASKKYYRWSFIVGLLSQPFWIYSTWQAQQWGMFFVSLWFTMNFIRGIRNHWKGEK